MPMRSLVIGGLLLSIAPPIAVTPPAGMTAHTTERARALHVLNRLAYGPRPGDLERVMAMGIDAYVEQQLHPERIPDERAERLLTDFELLQLSTGELEALFRAMRQERAQAARMRDSAQARGDMAGTPRSAGMQLGDNSQRLRQLMAEFRQVAVVRATLSERQLYEVMVNFWTNHFNVYVHKGAGPAMMPGYIEETIRPHTLGRFEDLLIATAKSPAMLYYLDNVESVAPGFRRGGQRGMSPPRHQPDRGSQMTRGDSIRQARRPTGLNENYARELLELHTLGVDGGYAQEDIIDVARILTGWTINIRTDLGFIFFRRAHDSGEKVVLGQTFPAGRGMEEGIELLQLLARHPSTRRHVSEKLCVRFVSDDPAPGCVDAAIHAWERSDGDIRDVLAAIFSSQEFWAPEHRATKMKTPLEFLISAVRALEATLSTDPTLAWTLRRLGQPLYEYEPPTGYPETQDSWVNSGALLERLNVAVALAAGRIEGVEVDLAKVVPVSDDDEGLVDAVDRAILSSTASANTRRVLREQAEAAADASQARALLVGLALGSPEFQRQ